ncbi:hypothetical protein [Thetidibacter halocola]|uniref:Uncharacterized protein n=1 Tax=Thetidibacter halocola TaxID=2827239 RepID=A0A8J8B6V2_9RHOB|nr:hypothetical protein [Thetidibacter halocola]MBS0124411.1 hypothetical protein [Thetidibacter halocola]
MPCTYRIFPGDNLVVFQHWGTITTAETMATLIAMRTDPQANPDHQYFVDFSRVARFDVDFGRMLSHVGWLTRQAPPRRDGALTALYAPSDVAFGVARMYQSTGDGTLRHAVGVFRSRAEAFAFLRIGDRPEFDIEPPLP